MGRPKLYSETARPVSVTLRVPADLAEKMKKYAYKHRQTVTRLLLEGLRLRLAQDGRQPTRRQLPPVPSEDLASEATSAATCGRSQTSSPKKVIR